MHTPRRKYHLTPHSLNEIYFNISHLSKIGMNSISRGAILISIGQISRQIGDIPKKFLEIYTKKNQCFLPQITLELFRTNLVQKFAPHFEIYSDINHITSNKNKMPSKKRITIKSSIQRLFRPRKSTLYSYKLISSCRSASKFINCYSHRKSPSHYNNPKLPRRCHQILVLA